VLSNEATPARRAGARGRGAGRAGEGGRGVRGACIRGGGQVKVKEEEEEEKAQQPTDPISLTSSGSESVCV
jgi:ribosomal protein L15